MAGNWINDDLVAHAAHRPPGQGIASFYCSRLVCHKLSKSYYSIFLNKSVPIVHCLVCQRMLRRTGRVIGRFV
jgi:hypothetical protein